MTAEININLHYIEKKSLHIKAPFASIYHPLEGIIAIYPQHIYINGVGETLNYNNISLEGEFIYATDGENLNIYFI